MIDILLSLLILTGAIFTFIGSLGLARLHDFYTRLHGPTKATTLGVGCLLIASAIYFSVRDEGISLHEVLVTLFLFITAPVSAHLLAKARAAPAKNQKDIPCAPLTSSFRYQPSSCFPPVRPTISANHAT
jgi:multicomponent K+:H+ antiporter subunit G